MAKFRVTKTWDHNLGLSVAFRQHPAVETHCRFVHGYPLAITAVFESGTLDHRNWVISFGELKPVKAYLEDLLDHKTLVAADDPHLGWFLRGEELGTMQVKIVQKVGCEAVAELIYENVIRLLGDKMKANNVSLVSIEVREHAGNSATYFGDVAETLNALPEDPYSIEIPTTTFAGALTAQAAAATAKNASSGGLFYVPSDQLTITGGQFGPVTIGSPLEEGGNKIRDIPSLTIKAEDLKSKEPKLATYSITVKDSPNLRVITADDFNYGSTAVVPALTENI